MSAQIFIRPNGSILLRRKDLNFLVTRKRENLMLTRSQLARLLMVYVVSFALVITLLNVQAITQQANYVKNNFTNSDEVLETKLLSDYYHQLEQKKRSVIPVEIEDAKPAAPQFSRTAIYLTIGRDGRAILYAGMPNHVIPANDVLFWQIAAS